MVTCKEFAQHVKNLVRVSIECETSVRRDRPSLAIISVGDDPASAAYVRGKIKDCEEVGITPVHIQLPADVSQGTLHSKIVEAHNCSGIIVQLHGRTDAVIAFRLQNAGCCGAVNAAAHAYEYTFLFHAASFGSGSSFALRDDFDCRCLISLNSTSDVFLTAEQYCPSPAT